MRKQELFKIKSYLTFPVLLALFFSACDNISFQEGITEGKIEYDVSYPNISEDNFMLDLLPKNMTTTFVDNSYRSDVVAGMGIFKTSIICNAEKEKLIHSIKMLQTKYASELSKEDFKKFNPAFNEVEVTFTDESKDIAGYNCKSADAKVLGDSVWTFKVFYTDEINIENVNAYTPFKPIKGVLMEYELLSNNVLMKFTATKVIQEDIDVSVLSLEEDYEMVEPNKLKMEIEKLFANII
ncbi:hypothetical protein N8371_09640 [Vicingaceae bacterium]|nr:hypothetical protein [Vicingaceae bacterium]MDC1452646.1 hypothetical protein [Vicingaceae bacterium]